MIRIMVAKVVLDTLAHMKKHLNYLSIAVAMMLSSSELWARPEYAAANSYVSCTACHASPTGGGILTINGKTYGSHEAWPNSLTKKEWFQIDSRMQGFFSQAPGSTRRGLTVMSTTPAVHIPVIENPLNHTEEAAFIFSYGLGLADTGLKDSYILLSPFEDPTSSTPFTAPLRHIMVGRFLPAFGLATDEHRTFTRVQSRSTVTDYEAGIDFSGDPTYQLHYDLALTSGFQSGGSVTPAVDDSPYGIFANMRWNPFKTSFFIGTSYMYHGTEKVTTPIEATSLYSVYALDRVINQIFKIPFSGSIMVEAVYSQGMNNVTDFPNRYITSDFFPDTVTTWRDALKESRSLGTMVQLNYNFNSKWTFLYKQESFTPDLDWKGDQFERHGFGAKYFLNSNMNINFRIERSFSTRPGITESSGARAANNMGFVMFHLWI